MIFAEAKWIFLCIIVFLIQMCKGKWGFKTDYASFVPFKNLLAFQKWILFTSVQIHIITLISE